MLELPSYDVWGLLGEGGMSQVWLAKHRTLATPVIVKTLLPAFVATHGEASASRIVAEAQLMARIHSPRIVRAIDAGKVESDGRPYLVQEYVDGLDLSELDRRRRAALGVGLPLWLVCHVMREISSGLRGAHQAGVIHRDLKPSNVFASAETGIRLGDFGIAVARSDGPPSDHAGTLAFMSPEQLESGEVGRHTDVWGAAAMACDLRYGQKPFASVGEILDRNRPPRLPEPTSPGEAYFQKLLRVMLAKNVAERPKDFSGPLSHFTMLASAVAPPLLGASRIDASTLVIGPLKLRFVVGDIAEARADAIVSSANFEMKMRSGVGEALRLRGGDAIEDEARAEGEKPLGSCVRTGSGTLDAKHVFHAVSAWNEVSCVGRAFARALLMADEHGCTSMAVPALGTGVARIGTEMCANAMITNVRWHLLRGGSRLRELTVYLDSEGRRRLYQETAEEILGLGDGGQLYALDVGLPVDDVPTSANAATFLDPKISTGPRTPSGVDD